MSSTPVPYPTLPSKLVLTSTKAYFSPARTVQYLESILDPSTQILSLLESHKSQILFVLIPDHLTVYPCSQILASRYPGPDRASLSTASWPLTLGAQNVFWAQDYGPYTGETVAPALASLGVEIVELNHAERRRLLGETDETSAKKAAAATQAGLIPLVCIGELDKPNLSGPLSQSVGVALAQLRPQIEAVLKAVPNHAPVIFAYEPVWAIGAAEPAGVDYVGPVVQAIRDVARSVVSDRTAEVKVVYGGSAGPGLWSGRSNGGNGLGKYVDGLFLGRFAHQVQGVKGVLDEVVESLKQDHGETPDD
ncbi:hypothetical protein PV10_06898 [Exophiala mesophila]|uniref:Triosephosphate isomerase n=1 Tax=Exophiala mesophila TaxID=212818 RepID=A0A0D1WKQ0_EXOME|nr:uncharacterized protein PV10_06898 [Exophiala mesophila]KIV89505.1 hypothetical protein PV10_06898 [Exophiala mesophila]